LSAATLPHCPFDVDRREAHAVVFRQHLSGRCRTPIDADQKFSGTCVPYPIGKEFVDRGAWGNIHKLREAATQVVNQKHFHVQTSVQEKIRGQKWVDEGSAALAGGRRD